MPPRLPSRGTLRSRENDEGFHPGPRPSGGPDEEGDRVPSRRMCDWGPSDQSPPHGLEALGAKIEIRHGYIEAKADALKGAPITFDLSTVTGTENLMMAAALARGKTTLFNAAIEPEVVELANVLNRMGAKIKGMGTPVIEIEGVEALHAVEHSVVSDRIEAGTLMVAAGLTRETSRSAVAPLSTWTR